MHVRCPSFDLNKLEKTKIYCAMTLAKSCHASNMMQDLEKATYRPIATMKAF